jgi:DNA-binding response OmpR family regulator
MIDQQAVESSYGASYELPTVERPSQRRRQVEKSERLVGPWSFRAMLGRGTIRLNTVEFRILKFLAARPYHAFTRRKIADAVSTESHPVTEENLGQYIMSLRDQLGFYSDYIQSVPYTGYRFKA